MIQFSEPSRVEGRRGYRQAQDPGHHQHEQTQHALHVVTSLGADPHGGVRGSLAGSAGGVRDPDQPAEHADVRRAVRAEADRRVVDVVAEAGAVALLEDDLAGAEVEGAEVPRVRRVPCGPS